MGVDGGSQPGALLGSVLNYLRHHPLLTEDTWADTKLCTEGVVEVRNVAEATIESDVEDPRRFVREAHRRLTKARPANVLVRRLAGQAYECAKEVVRTQTRLSAQAA